MDFLLNRSTMVYSLTLITALVFIILYGLVHLTNRVVDGPARQDSTRETVWLSRYGIYFGFFSTSGLILQLLSLNYFQNQVGYPVTIPVSLVLSWFVVHLCKPLEPKNINLLNQIAIVGAESVTFSKPVLAQISNQEGEPIIIEVQSYEALDIFPPGTPIKLVERLNNVYRVKAKTN